MNELMRMLATALPFETHVDTLKEAIKEYESAVLDDEKEKAESKLAMSCIMITYSHFDKGKSIEEVVKESETISQASDMVKKLQEDN